MKKYTTIFTILLFVVGFALHCVQPPNYPIEPVLTFKGLSKNVLLQSSLGQDSVIIFLGFTDGDGDIGFSDTTSSIFITDNRDNFSKPSFRLPKIAEQGAGNGVSGEISIVVPTTCCIYPANSVPPCDASSFAPQAFDTVTYHIQIKDRAGNLSNAIDTEPILLRCKN